MQFKTIVNPSFLVATLEMQDLFLEGWRIDPTNLPMSHIQYYEIPLVRDYSDEVKETFADINVPVNNPKKPVGRPTTKGAK